MELSETTVLALALAPAFALGLVYACHLFRSKKKTTKQH